MGAKTKQRLISTVAFVFLLVQSFSPYLYFTPAVLATNDSEEFPKTELRYDNDTNEFVIKAEFEDDKNKREIKYLLAYRTNEDKDEVIKGKTDEKKDKEWKRTIYAGTCSADDACTPHEIVRGLLKIKVEQENYFDVKRFIWENNNIKILEDYEVEQSIIDEELKSKEELKLTDNENNFLETGEMPYRPAVKTRIRTHTS